MTKMKKIMKNPYFLITAVYILAHFFMLILSGCWWDDWTFMTHNLNYINEVASQSGRPEWNLLVPLAWSSPNNGRILVFFLYLADAFFVYGFLRNCGLFDKEKSLLITWLFILIPVNDARILISNFAYSVGLFFFYLGMMLFVFWNKMENSGKKIMCRIGLLIIFFVGFILNSVLAYYYILIGYLFVVEMIHSEEKNLFRKIFLSVWNVLKKYPDFFVLPFVYYIENKIFFPTYGVFENYNPVSFAGLIKCLIYVPVSMAKALLHTVANWLTNINYYSVGLIMFAFLYIWYRDQTSVKEYKLSENILTFVLGLAILFMGIFPYVMVRGKTIDMIGVDGRDAVLVPLGAAMVICSVVSLCKDRARKILVALILILGIFGFNSLYLEWQKDYYYQLCMERLLDNDIIRENDTFFLAEVNETQIDGQRYYSLNTNAYHVFGDQTRFFIPKVSSLYILKDEKYVKEAIEVLDYSHMMKDYDPEDYCIDAVIDFWCVMTDAEVLDLKNLEMFHPELFTERLSGYGSMSVSTVDDDFTELLMEGYEDGSVKTDLDVLMLLRQYPIGD